MLSFSIYYLDSGNKKCKMAKPKYMNLFWIEDSYDQIDKYLQGMIICNCCIFHHIFIFQFLDEIYVAFAFIMIDSLTGQWA